MKRILLVLALMAAVPVRGEEPTKGEMACSASYAYESVRAGGRHRFTIEERTAQFRKAQAEFNAQHGTKLSLQAYVYLSSAMILRTVGKNLPHGVHRERVIADRKAQTMLLAEFLDWRDKEAVAEAEKKLGLAP